MRGGQNTHLTLHSMDEKWKQISRLWRAHSNCHIGPHTVEAPLHVWQGKGLAQAGQGMPRAELGGDTTITWTGKDGPGLI